MLEDLWSRVFVLPGFAHAAMLKYIDVKCPLLLHMDMIMTIERGKRREIYYCPRHIWSHNDKFLMRFFGCTLSRWADVAHILTNMLILHVLPTILYLNFYPITCDLYTSWSPLLHRFLDLLNGWSVFLPQRYGKLTEDQIQQMNEGYEYYKIKFL